MRLIIPKVEGRGAGLGNEMIVWAKAFIASQALEIPATHPAWGINPRKYYHYFRTSRLDWLTHRVAAVAAPSYTFTIDDYLNTKELDFFSAIKHYANSKALDQKSFYCFFVEGMWGSFAMIESAKRFLLGQLLTTRYTQKNLFQTAQIGKSRKIRVAFHIRLGDFQRNLKNNQQYQGQFNVVLPLEWYMNIADKIKQAFGGNVEFVLVSDGETEEIAPFLNEYKPITTFHQKNRDVSDLLTLASADLLVCSVSSYSMWAAFLSESPYIWFKEHLFEHEGFRSVWGLNDSERPLNSIKTKQNLCWVKQTESFNSQRSFAIDACSSIPDNLVELVSTAHMSKSPETDLVKCGVCKF